MILVEEWINESRQVRTQHLDMSTSCVERGGNSTVHRGVLAEYLDTNFPSKVDLCHACHNERCSNPKHLYWGTRKENIQDAKDNGTWTSGWDKLVAKHGYEKACEIHSNNAKGNTYGSGNKNKTKSEEHKKNISLNHKGGKPKGWRKENASVVK
jgi:hypothetical protein